MRGLAAAILGRKIVRAETRRKDLRWPLPDRMPARLAGARVESLQRAAKYMLAKLSSGETLIMHLGMTGNFRIADSPDEREKRDKHDHVLFDLDDGVCIVYSDPRRFGMMDLVETENAMSHRLLRCLGPDPLGNEFHEDFLQQELSRRNTTVKQALLDQRVVAGLGNIYACESLWRAGISPLRKAGRVSSRRVSALTRSIREILVEAIEAGGSSLRDYRAADGGLGYFQHRFQVYGRESKPCRTHLCLGTVRRTVQSGRSSFHCRDCQR